MSDTLSAGEEHDLQLKYLSDKHIDSLVQRMAELYKNHAKPVSVGEGAVTSVLPPEEQARWEALKVELEAYKKARYPLLPKDE